MKAIRLENVGKRFILTSHRDKVGRGFFSSFPGEKIATEFWALKGINMELEKGKVVGIIGRNGAGKTTLLNILAGISVPTVGKIEINGRVSSMLTLGAGFQDELTGRENIYLNSSILGMNRNEVNRKYRNIIDFSELDGFLNSPLQTYSQGMRLRLGFSIAINTDFDVLLTDEILSVGDVSFQKKCFDKIEEFRRQGKTMIIVTQSLDIIERICEEALLLENGELVQQGHPQKVAARYLELLNEKKLPETFQRRYGKLKWWADKRFWDKEEGSKDARIFAVKAYNSKGKETDRFKMGESVRVKAHFIVDKEIEKPHFGVAIFREDGVYCYGPNTFFDGYNINKINRGEGFFEIKFESLFLMPGIYRFSVAIWDKNEVWAYDYHIGFYKFEIIGKNSSPHLLNLNYQWKPDSLWQRFKISQLKKSVPFFNLNQQCQDKVASADIEVSSLELLNSSNEQANAFHTAEDLKIKLQFKFLKEPRDSYLCTGIFRSDDVYCHGVSRELNQKEKEVTLIYPKFPLLTGDYYLSIGIFKKNEKEPLWFKRKGLVFKVSFQGEDHGTVYLKHSWKWKLP